MGKIFTLTKNKLVINLSEGFWNSSGPSPSPVRRKSSKLTTIWGGYGQPRSELTCDGISVHVVDEIDEAEDGHGDPLGRSDAATTGRSFHPFTTNWHKGWHRGRGIQTTVAVLHRRHQLLVRMVRRYSGRLHVEYFQRMPIDESMGRHWLRLSREHTIQTTFTRRLALPLPP